MMEPAYRYRATADRIIDGDTYVLRLDLGFRVGLTINGRLRGVDTPEMNTPEGQEARQFVMSLIAPSDVIIVESYRDHQSFARWIVDVYLPDGRSLANVLIEAGHVK